MSLVSLIFALISTFAGLSAFVAFVYLDNYASATLAFTMGCLSLMLLHLHVLKYRNVLHHWYSSTHLDQIKRFGVMLLAIFVAITTYFIAIEVLTKQPIMPIATSVCLPIIWSLLCVKSAVLLVIYGRSYSFQVEEMDELFASERTALVYNTPTIFY